MGGVGGGHENNCVQTERLSLLHILAPEIHCCCLSRPGHIIKDSPAANRVAIMPGCFSVTCLCEASGFSFECEQTL